MLPPPLSFHHLTPPSTATARACERAEEEEDAEADGKEGDASRMGSWIRLDASWYIPQSPAQIAHKQRNARAVAEAVAATAAFFPVAAAATFVPIAHGLEFVGCLLARWLCAFEWRATQAMKHVAYKRQQRRHHTKTNTN